MNTYEAFFRNKRTTVEADSSYAAQLKAAAFFKAKRSYEVTVVLVAKGGNIVVHSTTELG